MLRKSISCISAGLLIAICLWLFIYAAEMNWLPYKVVPIAAIFVGIAGVIWLYDEIIADP